MKHIRRKKESSVKKNNGSIGGIIVKDRNSRDASTFMFDICVNFLSYILFVNILVLIKNDVE